ncbi:MAG: hypothetical protein K1X74_21900 [Pirellulales bacterium]|nr:hypothetical protein [Pirellulales bacterium]
MSTEAHAPSGTVLLPCPTCKLPSDSLKQVSYGTLMFIVLGWGLQRRREVACPRCAQRLLLWNAGFNVITANVLWPIIILPWTMRELWKTTYLGHDAEVLSLVDLPPATRPKARDPRPWHEAFPSLCRAVGLVQTLLGGLLLASVPFAATERWFRGDEPPTTARWVGALALGVAAYLVATGVGRLALRVPALALRVAAAAIMAVACWFVMPQLATQIWRYRETRYARSLIDAPYLYEADYRFDVPPQFWTPAAVQVMVDRSFEDYKCRDLLKQLDQYQPNNPAFAKIKEQLQTKLQAAGG